MNKNFYKILIVISARGNSKGVPGKNIKPLNGKPLISYAIRAARGSCFANEVIVSTEDDKIAEIAQEYGAKVPFKRPIELADDKVTLIAVTKHAMESLDRLGFRADIVVQLSPTCPFITSEIIDGSIQKVQDADSAVTVKRIEHEHPYRAKELFDGDKVRSFIKNVDVEKFLNRQELPELYCTSGAIYTRKRHVLESYSGKGFALGRITRAIILNEIQGINIDRPIDFMFAEFIMQNYEEFKRQGLV